jgi:ATP-dependent DNA helicase RecQ
MGIDKPDVRVVIHIDTPDSPEAYFQEAGRAGRDGAKAYAVLLYSKADGTTMRRRVPDTFPDKEYILKVYDHLQYFYQMAMGDGLDCIREFNIEDFCRTFKHFPVQVDSALKILTQAGYLEYTDEQDNASRIIFLLRRDELYRLSDENAETEALLQLIMRYYTGIFTDYAYINEDMLATRSGMSRQDIYNTLIGLSKRGIIHYIPRKKTPYIIYTRERVDSKDIVIPREVYEDRRERYVRRIDSMIEYATSQTVCRSRMLLRYFGEKNEHDCGQCDVCLARRSTAGSEQEFEAMQKAMTELLSNQSLTPDRLLAHFADRKELAARVLNYMIDEETARMKDGMVVL